MANLGPYDDLPASFQEVYVNVQRHRAMANMKLSTFVQSGYNLRTQFREAERARAERRARQERQDAIRDKAASDHPRPPKYSPGREEEPRRPSLRDPSPIAMLVRAYGIGAMIEVLKKLTDVFEPGETVFTILRR